MQSKHMKAYTNYYSEKDILMIEVDNYKYKTSLELEEGVILDFDINNNPVALEILYASEIFKLENKDLLNNIKKLDMVVETTEEVIRVEVKIEFSVQSEISSLKSTILNIIQAPVIQTELATF